MYLNDNNYDNTWALTHLSEYLSIVKRDFSPINLHQWTNFKQIIIIIISTGISLVGRVPACIADESVNGKSLKITSTVPLKITGRDKKNL